MDDGPDETASTPPDTHATRRAVLASLVASAAAAHGGMAGPRRPHNIDSADSSSDSNSNTQMTKQTEYQGWTVPTLDSDDDDADDWMALVDLLDGDLEKAVIKRGPRTARPANPPENAIYYATDEDVAYRYDAGAGAWIAAGWYHRAGQDTATAAYTRTGPSQEFEATAPVVGTRQTGAMIPLVGRQEQGVTSTSFTQVIPPFTFGYLESAPNTVPVLKCFASIGSQTAGEYTTIRVGTGVLGVGQPLFEFSTGTGTGAFHQYDEVYLNEVSEGTAARRPTTFEDANWQVWAKNSASNVTGSVYPKSTLTLDWEVV